MSNWELIQPTGTPLLNFVANPSFETGTAGWVTGGANTIARDVGQNYKGVASALVTYQNNTTLASYAVTFPAAATYKLTAFVYVPVNWDGGILRWNSIGFAGASLVQVVTWGAGDPNAEWFRIEAELTVIGGALVGSVFIDTDIAPTAGRTVYIDAVSVYGSTTLYTYWDGDQPGAEWLGTRHASVSRVSAVTRRIGAVLDLEDDFNFLVSERLGTGTEGLAITRDEYALLPGAQRNNTKQLERVFTLLGAWGNQPVNCDYHTNRETLIAELAHDAYPKDAGGWQQITLRYTGATTDKEILADYEADIGNTFSTLPLRAWPLRFRASDPFWYAIPDSGATLDSSDPDTFRYIARRSTRGDGQWNNANVNVNPLAGGTVQAILYASDGTVYVGGNFTGWDGNAGDDYIINYDPILGVWNTVGAAADLNGIVYGLAETANGDIIAVGAFTQNLPTQPGDYVARWDGTNWNAVGAPLAGAAVITDVRTVIVLQTGDYLVGGNFLNFANVANADYVAQWNGAAWIAPGGVLAANGVVYALAERTNGNFYAGGAFTQMTGGAAASLAEFNGTAWAQVGTGVNNIVYAMDYDPLRDELYAGGAFTQDGGAAITLNRALVWDNQALTQLGNGLNNTAFAVRRAPDGEIWFGGLFTTADSITLTDPVARWTGSSWLLIDAELNTAGTPQINAIDFSPQDPVVIANYNPYVGFNSTGAGTKAGIVTVVNPGTQRAFPQIQIGRSGGTAAQVVSIRNETTGLELMFDYDLLDGEQLFVNLDPAAKSIVSNFFGDVPGAVLPASDFGQWALLPGNNSVTAFVITDATVVVQLLWRAPYKSLDD